MQSARNHAYDISECFTPDFKGEAIFNEEKAVQLVSARDAEWQARVTRLEATLEECVEYIQRTDKVNPMEALYRGEGYSKDALPLIDKICAALGRGKHEQPHLVGRR